VVAAGLGLRGGGECEGTSRARVLGGGGLLEFDGDPAGGVGDGPGQAADDGLAGKARYSPSSCR
jgi:hypothetical protein